MNHVQITAGDSLHFTRKFAEYSPDDGWDLHYRLVPRGEGAAPIAFMATNEAGIFAVSVDANTTAAWAPGAYGWTAWVERQSEDSGERYTVGRGQVQVLPDLRQAEQATDTRTLARRALDDARAALASWNPTRRRYKIGEREMEFNSTADIIKLVTYWEQQVAVEDRLAGRSERVSRRIYTRM